MCVSRAILVRSVGAGKEIPNRRDIELTPCVAAYTCILEDQQAGGLPMEEEEYTPRKGVMYLHPYLCIGSQA